VLPGTVARVGGRAWKNAATRIISACAGIPAGTGGHLGVFTTTFNEYLALCVWQRLAGAGASLADIALVILCANMALLSSIFRFVTAAHAFSRRLFTCVASPAGVGLFLTLRRAYFCCDLELLPPHLRRRAVNRLQKAKRVAAASRRRLTLAQQTISHRQAGERRSSRGRIIYFTDGLLWLCGKQWPLSILTLPAEGGHPVLHGLANIRISGWRSVNVAAVAGVAMATGRKGRRLAATADDDIAW